MGLTDDYREDFKSHQTQLSLRNSYIKSTEKNRMETLPQPPPSTTNPLKKGWSKILRMIAHKLQHNHGDWLEEMRGNLSLVATVISTISFQALVNPPGGFVIQGVLSNDRPFGCVTFDDNSTACPGDAVSAVTYPDYFHSYLKYNTIAFISSLSVALLLVSGVPLKHKAVMWMLSIGMCITLTFLTLTYLTGVYLVTPDGDLFGSACDIFKVSLWSWIGFLGFVAVFITLRFMFWLGKKWMKKFKRRRSLRTRIEHENI